MITGDAVMNPVIDKDAFVRQPAPTRNGRMLLKQGSIDRRTPHLNRGVMSGAFNTVKGNLLLLSAVALEIADRDRDGGTG